MCFSESKGRSTVGGPPDIEEGDETKANEHLLTPDLSPRGLGRCLAVTEVQARKFGVLSYCVERQASEEMRGE